MQVFKVTRADGTDFRTGMVRYEVGCEVVALEYDPPSAGPCGRGLHVAPTARGTCRFGYTGIDRGKWRWFEVSVAEEDVVARDPEKLRVKRLRVERELHLRDLFGEDLATRVEEVKAEARSWATIPWCKPTRELGQADVAPILARWHEAASYWLAQRRPDHTLPRVARIIADGPGAIRAADQARRDAADAFDAAAVLDVADAFDAAAVALDAAAVADDAFDAAFMRLPYYCYHRPRWVLRRKAYHHLAGLPANQDMASPMVELYRLGVMPIGYVKGEFCLYVPPVVATAEAA